ncbi:MAG TPA: hypothetical protein VEY88_20575 [Archangium sp.]|nr:hypothetical protein [Archangium sp.]
MTRWTQVLVLVALSLVLGGSRCGEDEAVALEALRQDVAPPFDYALYCDVSGRLAGKNADVLLVHRAEHLERVYADAQRGDARARALFLQLKTQVRASGEKLAAQSLGLGCTLLPACTVRWQVLDELMPSRGAGGMRLRHLLAEGFAHEARLKGVENAVIAAVLDVLLVGSVLESAAGRAVQAEARAGLTEAERLARGAALEARLAEGMSLEEAAALEARLAEAEALESGARLPARLEELARHRPSVHQPPPGVVANNGRWLDYVAYWERRYEELAGTRPPPPGAPSTKPPLAWNSYDTFLGRFQRALEFQREVARVLKREVGLAKGARQWLRGLEQPLVMENVGLAHEGRASLTYVDQLVVDEASLRPGQRPTVHSFSNKQRDFRSLSADEIKKQLQADVTEALTKYGGMVEVRRPAHPLFGRKASVSRVHLVYDEKGVTPEIKKTIGGAAARYDIELHFHAQP